MERSGVTGVSSPDQGSQSLSHGRCRWAAGKGRERPTGVRGHQSWWDGEGSWCASQSGQSHVTRRLLAQLSMSNTAEDNDSYPQSLHSTTDVPSVKCPVSVFLPSELKDGRNIVLLHKVCQLSNCSTFDVSCSLFRFSLSTVFCCCSCRSFCSLSCSRQLDSKWKNALYYY